MRKVRDCFGYTEEKQLKKALNSERLSLGERKIDRE